MATQLDEWDPMREHFHDRRLNSYRSGMGHDLRVTRQEAPGGNKNVTLYIRGVPFGLSPAALEKLFSDHGGRVIQAKIPQNQDASRHSANYAFVIMADATGAQRAIENLDGFRIKEHTLSVQVALSKEEMARRDERRKREEDFMKKLNLSISWQEGKESEANSSVSEAGEGVIGRGRGAVLEDKQLSTSSSDDSTMQNGDGLHGPLSSIPANQNKKQSDKSKSQKKQQPGKGMGRGDQLGSKSGPAGVGGHRQASTQAMFLMGRGQALNRLLNDSEAGFRRTQFDERSVTGTESGRSECITCGTETTSRCKCCKTPYCSRECQVKDWPEHSKICMDIRNKLHPIPQFSGQQPLVDLSNFDVDIDDGFMVNHKEFFNSILRAANEGSDSSSDRETFKGSYTKKSHETPKTSDQKQKGGLKPSTQTKRALQKKQKRGPSSSSSSQNSGEVTAVGSVYLDRKTLPPQPRSRPQENNRSLQTQYPQQEKKMPPGPPGVKQQQGLLPTPVYPGAPPGRMFPTGNRFQGPRPNNGLGQGSRWSGQPARGGGLQNEQPPRQDSTMYRHDDQKHSDPAEGSIGCGAKNDRGRGQQKKFTCHRCGEKGHFIKDCPKQAGRGSSDRRAGSRSFQQTLEKGRAHVAEEGDQKWDVNENELSVKKSEPASAMPPEGPLRRLNTTSSLSAADSMV